MNWQPALTTAILDGKAADRFKSFLHAQIKSFQAPVNPVAWTAEARRLRKRALQEVFLKGFPRAVVQSAPRVVWGEVIRPCSEYAIRKLRYECYPNYWIPALLYVPARLRGRVPVVLNPNGHHSGGKAAVYKQIRCANLARRGVLALSTEFIGMGELQADRQHNGLAMLNLTGLAGVGLFYLALQKGLDVLLQHPHADSSRVGVTGLSGGGWQTIVISALDERVTLSVPVAGYTAVKARIDCPADMGDLEQVPVDLTTVIDYQDMTAMLAPRPALLILNQNDDCCFQTARTRPLVYDAVQPTYRAFKAEADFQFHNNTVPGTHNYESDNRSRFYRFLMEQWGLPGPARDIHHARDVLPESRLNVGLPLDQESLQSLAIRRARALARRRRMPATNAEREALRQKIRDIIRLPAWSAAPAGARAGFARRGGILQAGPWEIPVSVAPGPKGSGAELIVADIGRQALPADEQGFRNRFTLGGARSTHRFIADITGMGENAGGWQLGMILEGAGHRLLGHQVAQVLATARAAGQATGAARIRLVAEGSRTCLVALLATALEPARFESLTCYRNLSSLALLLETYERYETLPELFCFGLLAVADVPELVSLLEDTPYRQPSRAVPPLNRTSPDRHPSKPRGLSRQAPCSPRR
jgi:dienelactone hydrolase